MNIRAVSRFQLALWSAVYPFLVYRVITLSDERSYVGSGLWWFFYLAAAGVTFATFKVDDE